MTIGRGVSRRRVLASAGAALGGAIAAPRLVYAQTKTLVKFTLPWVADGSNLFTFVAKTRGYWDKHGLDVSIARGSGSVAAAEAIGAGRFDFGMAAPLAAILQTVKGLPLVALGCCAYDATMGIGALDDGPIKTPKDLEGRRMASTVTSGEYPFLPVFAEKAGFDLAKVTRIQVDNKVRDRLLSEHKVDAISGFATTFMAQYVASGVKAHAFLYSRYGIPNYGSAILTQPARLAAAPQLCAAFTDGMLQGLKATMLDPAEAINILFKAVPELALAPQMHAQIRIGTGLLISVSARDLIKTHGMGYLDPGDYAAQIDLVMKYLAKPGEQRPQLAQVMTNRFAGDIRLTPTEWQEMKKNARQFRAYLS
ncbi:MAG TPA: ABC transporter substrate-binding protein [Stellaceae bacterium]|nr:ABC transporter substrate-binding protein [Stellaceae bacterium]